jgi:ABC-2 type transport system ATP-binding protein
MAELALRIRDLEKTYGSFTLGPLDLDVPKGAIYGYVGSNGAGKSTTMNLIMGMGRMDSGRIEVLDLDHIEQEAAMKSKIGYVSPDLSFNAWGKVDKLISFMRGFYEDWDDDYCESLLERLKIGWKDRISTLSFGSRTKLGLVLALSHRPPLLLLDEPLAGLDAISKQEIFAELLEAVQDETRTVFISSHNLDDIERFTDHIGILHQGRLLLEGPTTDLIERFRMVDCTLSNGNDLSEVAGLVVQKNEGGRCRALVDTHQDTLQSLVERGASDLADSPVTLEELFVALVKD